MYLIIDNLIKSTSKIRVIYYTKVSNKIVLILLSIDTNIKYQNLLIYEIYLIQKIIFKNNM